ncbi:MAG: hypothetical protein OIF35_08090, partial [Cellvibrionaceae bacterium]|nr:hypothetical protein [Cellvibrionaceae bacterium]
LGFVKSVNRGMLLNPGHDVILLNVDTEVQGDWVARLAACAYSDREVATVTPFSNNATVCSYPSIFHEAEPVRQLDLKLLDEDFAKVNRGQYIELPTAVGFCMYIKRSALNVLGLFDEDAFGRGYGEECDFSMRAKHAGFGNVLAADVYVAHHGGASFGEDAEALKANGAEVLHKRYPQYEDEVTAFVDTDPACELRDKVDDFRLSQNPALTTEVVSALRFSRDAIRRRLLGARKSLNNTAKILSNERMQFLQCDAQLKEARHYLEERERSLQTTIEQLQASTEQLQSTDAALAKVSQQALDRLAQLQQINARLEASEIELEAKKAELQAVYNSRSWRYTQWIRNILEKK